MLAGTDRLIKIDKNSGAIKPRKEQIQAAKLLVDQA
jgi:hypothetical protein